MHNQDLKSSLQDPLRRGFQLKTRQSPSIIHHPLLLRDPSLDNMVSSQVVNASIELHLVSDMPFPSQYW